MTFSGLILQDVQRNGRSAANPEALGDFRHVSTVMDLVPGAFDEFVAGFNEQVAIVDENWTIISVNEAWKQMVVAGYPELVPGTDYRDFLETFVARGHENAAAVLAGVRAIDRGEVDSFEFTYPGVDQWEGRALRLRIHRFRFQGRIVATIARQDVTDSMEVDRVRQDCTAAILNSETEARQRLTRELHDSTAQLLTSIGLLLTALKQKTTSPDTAVLVDESQGLLSQATQEIRCMSYLADAPDIVRIGIVQALEGLGAGFARRAKLAFSFRIVGTRTQLRPATKTTVYRIAQEALSNVHRHADAKHLAMSLVFRKAAVHLVVTDDGIGISSKTLAGNGSAGVGMRGMRCRLSAIGGRLSVRRLRPGTAVVASIPLV